MNAPSALASLRDLGGLRTATGGTTRTGVLLRSDAPYANDVDTGTEPAGWPPAVVLDLRGSAEAAASPRIWGSTTTVHSHELYTGARPGAISPNDNLIDLYRNIVTDAADQIVAVVDLLATDRSTLVHCAAGKDRTGIVVAVLLALADVDDDAIVADYVLTADAMPEVVARLSTVGGLPDDLEAYREWLGAPEEAIRVVLDELRSHPGGPSAWFLSQGGNEAALTTWLECFVS